MSTVEGAEEGNETLPAPAENFEEKLEKLKKDMQDLTSEGMAHLGQYYLLQGSIVTGSYQISWSDHCHHFKWICIFSLAVSALNGVPYLLKSYAYAKTKNERDGVRLKYDLQKNPGLNKEGKVGTMCNYATLFGSPLLLILVSTAIFITVGHYFLCDKKEVDFQKLVMINNPIIRLNNAGGCYTVCNNQNECLKTCAN